MLLLMGGIALSASRSFGTSIKIIEEICEGWDDINRQGLERAVNSLFRYRLLEERKDGRGNIKIVLSEEGRKQAEFYSIDDLKVEKPAKWDKNWRIVMFDIPENLKKVREAFRYHLKNLEFYEYQKSVFIHPFPCVEEISYIVEFYGIRKYVRNIISCSLDNEYELKEHFGLLT